MCDFFENKKDIEDLNKIEDVFSPIFNKKENLVEHSHHCIVGYYLIEYKYFNIDYKFFTSIKNILREKKYIENKYKDSIEKRNKTYSYYFMIKNYNIPSDLINEIKKF